MKAQFLALTALVVICTLQQQHQPGLADETPATQDQIVVAKLRGMSRRLDLVAGQKAGQLRAKIAEMEKTEPGNVVMVFGGQHLKDDQELASYGIAPESRVIFILKSEAGVAKALECVTIRVGRGNSFEVAARAEMSVAELKQAIERLRPEAPASKQKLTLDSVELADADKLGDLRVRNGAVLLLKTTVNEPK